MVTNSHDQNDYLRKWRFVKPVCFSLFKKEIWNLNNCFLKHVNSLVIYLHTHIYIRTNLLRKPAVELCVSKQCNKSFNRKFILMEEFNRKSNMTVIFNQKVSTNLAILFPRKSVKLDHFFSINVIIKNSFTHSS